jgi:hypothetical protein
LMLLSESKRVSPSGYREPVRVNLGGIWSLFKWGLPKTLPFAGSHFCLSNMSESDGHEYWREWYCITFTVTTWSTKQCTEWGQDLQLFLEATLLWFYQLKLLGEMNYKNPGTGSLKFWISLC